MNSDDLSGKFVFLAPIAWTLGRIALQYAAKHAIKYAAKRATQASINRTAGAAGEKAFAAVLRFGYPFHKIQTKRADTGVFVKGQGWRYSDIKMTNRFTGKVTRYEIKTGNARYNSKQMSKDRVLAKHGQKTKCYRLKWNYKCY